MTSTILPFKGIWYDREKVGDLGSVTSPPYDQIPLSGKQEFLSRSPFNIVALTLGEGEWHQGAAALFHEWLRTGVLCESSSPSLYLYRQKFSLGGGTGTRTGVVALVKAEYPGEGAVFPHERVLPRPLDDRIKLMEVTRANFEPVFLLYSDPEGVGEALKEAATRLPPHSSCEVDGEEHTLWEITDPSLTDGFCQAMEGKKFIIADGHHRYTAACEVSRRVRENGAAFCMAVLYRLEDPDLKILPTHRVIRRTGELAPPPTLKSFQEKLQGVAEVRAWSGDLGELLLAMKESRYSLGLYRHEPEVSQDLFLITLLPSTIQGCFPEGYPAVWQTIPVGLLHGCILPGGLGIGATIAEQEKFVWYVRWPDDGIRMIREGDGEWCFFLNPTSVEQVREVAMRGERMPQKSTDFYPKLRSGLFLRRFS